MYALSKKAGIVLDELTKDLNELSAHKKVDNAKGAFMAVSVERVEETDWGPVFSVAHYYEQNGDLMRDPEMCFLRGCDGLYYPTYFRQDGGLAMEENSVVIENGKVKGFKPVMQYKQSKFANMWMKNIKEQQGL